MLYLAVSRLLIIRHFYYFQGDSIFSFSLVFASLLCFIFLSGFCLTSPIYFLLILSAFFFCLLSATLSRCMLPLSIFSLLSSAFCAELLRYLTSYLLLFCTSILWYFRGVVCLPFAFFFNLRYFSWFVLLQSTSLSPFDSILFPPPAALLLLLSGSLLASYSCLDDWIF